MIEDRPVTEFELDCIVQAAIRVRKYRAYLELLKQAQAKKQEAKENIRELELPRLIEEIYSLAHELGFFEGEMFNIVKQEKGREIDENINKE